VETVQAKFYTQQNKFIILAQLANALAKSKLLWLPETERQWPFICKLRILGTISTKNFS